MSNKAKRTARMSRIPTAKAELVRPESDLFVRTGDGSLLINTAKLPVPERSYDADFAWVSMRFGVASLFFGKEGPNKTLKTRVEIKYAFEAFALAFWKNSREFHAAMRARAGTRRLVSDGRAAIQPETMLAEKETSFWANIDVLARVGNEASLDFFHLPPRPLALYLQNGVPLDELSVTPILRVMLSTDELSRLLEMCIPKIDEMTPFLELRDELGEAK